MIQDGNRCSCDDKIDSHGSIETLKTIILKLPVDKLRSYTCFSRGGPSLVDYLLVENTINQKVENLKILTPDFDSRNTPITATFRIKSINDTIGKLFNPPKAYSWHSQGSAILSH